MTLQPGTTVTWHDRDTRRLATGIIRSIADNELTAFIKLLHPEKIRGGKYVIRHVIDLRVAAPAVQAQGVG